MPVSRNLSGNLLSRDRAVNLVHVESFDFEFEVESVFRFIVTEQDIEYNIVSSWKTSRVSRFEFSRG